MFSCLAFHFAQKTSKGTFTTHRKPKQPQFHESSIATLKAEDIFVT